MKIGYPCINTSLEHKSSRTFRLASYSEERLVQTITNNLYGLEQILAYNVEHTLLLFRISSDLIPFASHAINTFPWQKEFQKNFVAIGNYIKNHDMRISMHPDQFTLINSPSKDIFERSVAELAYHAEILDLMELDTSHKLQIHIGGVYGDKKESIKRFIQRYKVLPENVQQRLVIENDDRLYTVTDSIAIHEHIGIPILFDNLHHEINNRGETVMQGLAKAAKTWKNTDGIPMIDYSLQEPNKRVGNHAQTIDVKAFTTFLEKTTTIDFNIMLEIKDKEKSALKAYAVIQQKRL